MRNIFVSFSGGESSAYLLMKVLEEYYNDNILVCFANTGDENEETLLFVKKLQDYYDIDVLWLEAYVSKQHRKGVMPVIVNYENASRDGTPLLDQSEKLGHAAITASHCTRDLKVRSMHKFAKVYFEGQPYTTMQGIRYDESSRVNWEKAKKENWEYPLIEWKITKPYINKYWEQHERERGFRLNLEEHQGNCNLCFKKSDKKLIKLIREKPCLILFRITLELISKTDKHDQFRKNRTAVDLLELAASDTKTSQLSIFGGQCFCA